MTLFNLNFQTSIFNKPDDVFDDDESDVDHPQPAYRQYETTVRSLSRDLTWPLIIIIWPLMTSNVFMTSDLPISLLWSQTTSDDLKWPSVTSNDPRCPLFIFIKWPFDQLLNCIFRCDQTVDRILNWPQFNFKKAISMCRFWPILDTLDHIRSIFGSHKTKHNQVHDRWWI